MENNTLILGIAVSDSPEQVFAILTDPVDHSRFTGGESKIDAKVGGRFSYFGGALSGVFKELVPGKRIVQDLRASDWPEGHLAQVTQEFNPQSDGRRTYIRVVEQGIPAGRLDEVMDGWQAYWESFSNLLRQRKVDVIHRFVAEYKNNHNSHIVDELVSEDCAVHIPLPGLAQGREGMRTNGLMVNSAFPDVHVTTEFVITEDDIVIERGRAVATHLGELVGIAPTGRQVKWTELHAYRVTNGQIAEVWTEADFMGMMAQIGAVQPPGS